MKSNQKLAMGAAVAALIVLALGAWWWNNNMRLEWQHEHRAAPLALKHPFLGATWLLDQNGHKVTTVESVREIDARKLPDGTLLMGGGRGIFTDLALLEWVKRGNTLIYQPQMLTREERKTLGIGDDDDDEDNDDTEEGSDTAAGDDVADDEHTEAEEEKEEASESAPASSGAQASTAPASASAESSSAPPGPRQVETDIVGQMFGVRSDRAVKTPTCGNLVKQGVEPDDDDNCPAGMVLQSRLSTITVPGSGKLIIDTGHIRIAAIRSTPVPIWNDSRLDSVQGYRHGKGTVVIAPGNLFTNPSLQHHDHGALLLALARLAPGKHVTIVKSSDFISWQRLLWLNYRMALTAAAVLLALLFWSAVRRFGPLLPAPVPARRSLMEHIDASGAWLWKARGGRLLLVDAARADLQATLQRRAPALLRLPEAALHDELARQAGLPATDIAHAMHYEPASVNADFTRQIRTLQTLRKHYER